MTGAVPDILARIIEHKRQEPRSVSSSTLEERAIAATKSRRDFLQSLQSRPVGIIAEIKKASPSKGVLSRDFHPAAIAEQYEAGGAAALSVLTDERFFQGSLQDLEAARGAVSLPVLRKDFTLDEYHVLQAAAYGADAILLIAAALDTATLRSLRRLAASYRMAAIVEVHDGDELSSALDSGANIIGVNNRNLHTFEVSLETSLRLAERMPSSIVKISESGIETRAQIATLQQAGYSGFLIGEHLMRSGNPAEALRVLTCS